MYKFLLLLLLSVWGAPAVATVTLGEIDVRSFLNQPLQAQISAQGSGLTDPGIEVGLASEEVYRRAGMVRGALPSDLSIQLEGAGTSRLVRLTTQQPVREPYLGLLLEARWSAGRIFREYTILLDPPRSLYTGARYCARDDRVRRGATTSWHDAGASCTCLHRASW